MRCKKYFPLFTFWGYPCTVESTASSLPIPLPTESLTLSWCLLLYFDIRIEVIPAEKLWSYSLVQQYALLTYIAIVRFHNCADMFQCPRKCAGAFQLLMTPCHFKLIICVLRKAVIPFSKLNDRAVLVQMSLLYFQVPRTSVHMLCGKAYSRHNYYVM